MISGAGDHVLEVVGHHRLSAAVGLVSRRQCLPAPIACAVRPNTSLMPRISTRARAMEIINSIKVNAACRLVFMIACFREVSAGRGPCPRTCPLTTDCSSSLMERDERCVGHNVLSSAGVGAGVIRVETLPDDKRGKDRVRSGPVSGSGRILNIASGLKEKSVGRGGRGPHLQDPSDSRTASRSASRIDRRCRGAGRTIGGAVSRENHEGTWRHRPSAAQERDLIGSGEGG